MYGMYDRWYMYVAMLPCHTDGHLCIPCYPLHSAFSLSRFSHPRLNRCFVSPRMVNTRNNPAVQAQGEANAARAENLPQPPSLAEVMLEAERNKRETNRLLERIEQNTARYQRNDLVSINDFIKLYPTEV